jgi:hypothetical protein
MYSLGKLSSKVAFAVLITSLISTGAATARSARVEARPDFLQGAGEAPEAKLQKWQETINSFIYQKPELSSEQAQAVLSLADFNDENFFADTISADRRILMTKQFETLARVLPYTDYRDLMRDLGSLRGWLIKNEVIIGGEGGTCNCDTNSDCTSGYRCTHSGCTVGAGSNSNGVCN